MIPIIGAFDRLAERGAGLAWTLAWQSTLVVGAFALVALGMRRSSPGLRYWLWQIAAIKLLLMPLWVVPVALPMPPRRDAGPRPGAWPPARTDGQDGARPSDRLRASDGDPTAGGRRRGAQGSWTGAVPADWRGWLVAGWGLAVAGQVAAIARQRSRLRRLLRRTVPADDPELLTLVDELSARIGLAGRPEVLLADGEGSPFVCGLRRPALVLPPGLARMLGADALRAVLLHELAHIRRRDLLWDWIPAVARLLYFFHPAAHYIASRARLERELACDQAAMVLSGQGAAGYASTLVEVVSRSSAQRALRGASASTRLDGDGPCPGPGPWPRDR